MSAGLLAGHRVGLFAHDRLPAPTLDRLLVSVLAAVSAATIAAGAAGIL